MLALPLAREAADDHERGAARQAGPGGLVGLDQQRQPLDLGEAAHVQQHRRLAVLVGERRQVGLRVRHRPRGLARRPAARLVHQMAPPVRLVVDLPGMERLRVEPVRDQHAAVGLQAEQVARALHRRLREHDHPLAGGGPAAQPVRPLGGMGPPAGIGLDRLQHQQLGAVEMPDHRHAGSDARGRLVDRCQVVQVQDVGVRRAGRLQRVAPRHDLALVLVVVERREDAVGRARPVLVGRVHRRVRQHRVGRLERARHVQRADVEPGIELARVARLARSRQRARHDRDVPARRRPARSRDCAPRGPTRHEGRRRAPSRPAAAVNDL